MKAIGSIAAPFVAALGIALVLVSIVSAQSGGGGGICQDAACNAFNCACPEDPVFHSCPDNVGGNPCNVVVVPPCVGAPGSASCICRSTLGGGGGCKCCKG
jgi:hypothetical protein